MVSLWTGTVLYVCLCFFSMSSVPSQWPLLALYQLNIPGQAPPFETGPPSLTGRGRVSQLSWPGWLRVGEASCSTGAVPSHFHFIYLPPLPFLFPPPSIHPSIPSSFLVLPLPVDQYSLHAELLCAQSAVAEQMASLCFFTLFLRL